MSELKRNIKIFIDGSEATDGIKKIEKSIGLLEQRISQLDKSETDYNKKSQELQKQLEKKNKTLNTYKQKAAETEQVLRNLSGATHDQLAEVRKKVQLELRSAIPGTQKHTAALEQHRRVSIALAHAQREMNVEIGCQASFLGKAAIGINKYAGLIGGVLVSATGLLPRLNKMRDDLHQRGDIKADVAAITGLSEESIQWLEQQAIRLSTTITASGVRIRQDASEILEAFKLVGSAKPELLSNKEALAEVTEQALILATASGMELKGAVDAVTLSLNQYGDGANQAARYANIMAAGSKFGAAAVESITKAVTKSGVAASGANVPIEQLVGSIETLAEKGIKDEVAGTGLKKFFLTLQTGADETNPKIVGLETALKKLQQQQLSATAMKKMFGEEGFNVASVLINEAEKVKYYTEAVTGTGVAVEQAATKSNTAAAKLAQANNHLKEMGILLINQLSPAMEFLTSSLSGIIRGFTSLIKFLNEHSAVLITLTAAVVTYYTTVKLATFYENTFHKAKLLSVAADKLAEKWAKIRQASLLLLAAAHYTLKGNTDMATAAFNRLNTSMKSNIFGLVLSLVASVGVAIWQFANKSKEAAGATSQLHAELIKEQITLNRTFDALRKTTEGTEERKRLIKTVNETYREYLPNLLSEKSSLNEINTAYELINKALERQIALKIKNESIEKVVSDSIKEQADTLEDISERVYQASGSRNLSNLVIQDVKRITAEYQKAGSKWQTTWGSVYHTISHKYFNKQSLGNGIGESLEEYIKQFYLMNVEIRKVEQKFKPFTTTEKSQNELPEVVITADATTPHPSPDGSENRPIKGNKRLEEEKTEYARQQAELRQIYLAGNDEQLQTEQQFQERMLQLKEDYLQRAIQAVGESTQEGMDLQRELDNLHIEQKKEKLQQDINAEKQAYEQQVQALKELYISGKDETLLDEEAYNEAMEQLTIMHLERMLSLAGLNSEQQRDIQRQLTDFKIKCIKDEQQAQARAKSEENKKNVEQTRHEAMQYKERLQTYNQYGAELGRAVGAIISKQENAMSAFTDAMIDMLFDLLKQIVQRQIEQTIATSIGAQARATAESMAMPDSVASYGAAGSARAAVLSGLITGAMTAAMVALKALFRSDKKSSSSSTSTADSSKRAAVTVSQWATGRYDVIGKEDGKTYRDIPYIGHAPTGIVRRTSLVSETGAELIINAEDLARLQKHINYPLVLSAINDARRGEVPQRATGNYTSIETDSPGQLLSEASSFTSPDMTVLIRELKEATHALRNLKAYVSLTDIRRAESIDQRARRPFTRSEH